MVRHQVDAPDGTVALIKTYCDILTEKLLTVCDLLSGAFHVKIT